MTTQNESERITVHHYELARKHQALFAISQILLGLATSTVQERLTDDDRHNIACFMHDQIDQQRHEDAFDLHGALQG